MEFRELSEKEFVSYLTKSELDSFMQSPKMDIKGVCSYYVGVLDGKKVVAAARLTSRKNRFGYNYFYSPRGLLLDYKNEEVLRFFTSEIKKFIKEKKGYVLHIDPNILCKSRDANGEVTDEYDNTDIVEILKRHGYVHAGYTVGYDTRYQVRWQYVIDLENKTFDEVVKDFKPHHLSKIKKAEKFGIIVKDIEYDDLPTFKKITEQTSKLIGFSDRSLEYYQEMYKSFGKDVRFLIAYLDVVKYKKQITEELDGYNKKYDKFYNKENNSAKEVKKNIDVLTNRLSEISKYDEDMIPISASMFMLYGDEVIYLFSGNVDKYNNFYAQYLIQWIMIKYAVENKYKKYNFYGIKGDFSTGKNADGVYEFKKGFGGHVEELIGDFYLPINWFYYFNELVRKIRK